MRKILNQPYPFYYSYKNIFSICMIGMLLGFLFLFFFRPFDITPSEHKYNYLIICMSHTIAAGIAGSLVFVFAKQIIKNKEKWTLGKETFLLIVVCSCIGLANFLIRDLIYDSLSNWTLLSLWEEVKNAFLTGIILIYTLLTANYIWLQSRYQEGASNIRSNKNNDLNISDSVFILEGDGKEERLSMKVSEFIFAKSEGNYVLIYHQPNDIVEKKMIRSTISHIEAQIAPNPNLYRCHRSYIVNLSHISSVEGNAQGYKILVSHTNIPIPVSRSKSSDFELKMKSPGYI